MIINNADEIYYNLDAEWIVLNPINENKRASWHRLVSMINTARCAKFQVEFEYIC